MRMMICGFLALFLVSDGIDDSPEPPILNKRIPISTLVREDVFAGWMENDMERFARAEKNIDLLLD